MLLFVLLVVSVIISITLLVKMTTDEESFQEEIGRLHQDIIDLVSEMQELAEENEAYKLAGAEKPKQTNNFIEQSINNAYRYEEVSEEEIDDIFS